MDILKKYNQPTKIFNKLKELAASEHLIEIQYQKAVIDKDPHWRTIEPYSLTTGKQDVMLRAFQLEPEPGWRFFMVHKIKSLRPTDKRFTPRRKMTISSGVALRVYEPYETWTPVICEYRDLILSCLADNIPTADEITTLASFRKKNNILKEHIRSVHICIFNNCLTHLLCDGIVSDEEQQVIADLHNNLTKCGCGILE